MPTTTGLPSELWTEVLGHLSRTDQQTCLHLSRLHRVLALRCLFPMVHVYFGLHGSDKLLYIEQIQQEEAAARRSFDILDAIIFEPAFAGAVKKVVVHAFCAHSAIFEIGLLVRALKAIENLRSFVWIGIKPRIPDSVVNALQERCPSLREFNIDEYRFYDLPSSRFVNIGYNSDLSAFTGLTHVSIASDEFDDDDTRGVLALISANARTLTHLVGTDNVVWPSLRAFSSLTHLEIVRCDQTDNLPLVFQHAPQLRSLDLPDAHPGVFRALVASPDTLPELESFRLSVVNSLALDDAMIGVDDPTPTDAGAYEAVFRFLESKRANLRRLALNVEGATHADVHRFIDFVRTLPRLDVLGVTIYSRHMSVLTFERFGDALSDRLQMFSVSFVWNLNDILVEEFLPLVCTSSSSSSFRDFRPLAQPSSQFLLYSTTASANFPSSRPSASKWATSASPQVTSHTTARIYTRSPSARARFGRLTAGRQLSRARSRRDMSRTSDLNAGLTAARSTAAPRTFWPAERMRSGCCAR